ncbi:MAG: type IV pili twitching motility protein PilT [Campylobacteraceae bacterium 4484_4]|nr:MAG: type IV pili twitching motility protein PilT [Campylobacteraceae bacterium 4484_4]
MVKKLRYFLNGLIQHGGSDLHIKSGSNIRGRINGEMVPMTRDILSHADGIQLAKEVLKSRFAELVEKKSIDFTFKLDEKYRFRGNMFFQSEGVSAVFRVIPVEIPTMESLKLPLAVKNLCTLKRGLVLVTGPTGSGKSTTLASIINQINMEQKKHIITIEDPIEFIYKDRQSLINQRSMGQDATDFQSALRAALREDPDVILVGEMRDMETIETAMHAAETGHLVLSTLHTVDAKDTINRIIGMFPGNEQNKIRMSLAATLQGVLSQRLVKTKDNKRVAAIEILLRNARIESLIAEGRDSEITDAIAEGKDIYGMQTFDQALLDLYARGIITEEEALLNATNKSDLKMQLDSFNSANIRNPHPEESIISLKRED